MNKQTDINNKAFNLIKRINNTIDNINNDIKILDAEIKLLKLKIDNSESLNIKNVDELSNILKNKIELLLKYNSKIHSFNDMKHKFALMIK
jgi:hypothetical protein